MTALFDHRPARFHSGMGQHWRKCKAKGKRLEACIAIGVVPSIAYSATAKIPYDFDEYRLAGGLAGAPVELAQAKTVDLLVPATAEIIIEGTIPTDIIEPEGPFGEYPGYMGHRSVSPFLEITCITHRRDAIYTALMSHVAVLLQPDLPCVFNNAENCLCNLFSFGGIEYWQYG